MAELILFVPGPWASGRDCPKLDGASVEHVENDGHFAEAFAFAPGISKRALAAIDAAPGAVVVNAPLALPREWKKLAALGKQLAKAGALGVRFEQSKAPWELEPWLELVSSGEPRALYRCAVVTLGAKRQSSTCGMHVFGLPDAEVAAGADEAGPLLAAFNCYQLEEDPVLVTGHTFSPDASSPKRRLERWPDGRYPEGHPCHNPFGTWRLGAAGGKASGARELACVFMPSLAAVLTAAESAAKRPLTRAQVERITQEAACMTMSHEHARAHERTRGYVDLDPELAWEQWQVLRSAR